MFPVPHENGKEVNWEKIEMRQGLEAWRTSKKSQKKGISYVSNKK